MLLTTLGIVLPSLAAAISSVLVWQLGTANRRQAAAQATRAARLEERKVDREELQSAIDFWRQSFDAVTLDNRELRKELEQERRETRRLTLRVGRLEDALRRAGLAVPNGQAPDCGAES